MKHLLPAGPARRVITSLCQYVANLIPWSGPVGYRQHTHTHTDIASCPATSFDAFHIFLRNDFLCAAVLIGRITGLARLSVPSVRSLQVLGKGKGAVPSGFGRGAHLPDIGR